MRPATMQAFGKVQNLAQNPRIRATLPLQRKLANFIQVIQTKWRSRNLQLCEKYILDQVNQSRQKLLTENVEKIEKEISNYELNETLLCFKPPKETVIHRPMLQLNELLSSYNICLNSYEEKIGAITRGETLCEEKIKEMMKIHSKRVRHDSGTEKNISPELKKPKQEDDKKIDIGLETVMIMENGSLSSESGVECLDMKNDSDSSRCASIISKDKDSVKEGCSSSTDTEFTIKSTIESSAKTVVQTKTSLNLVHSKIKRARDALNCRSSSKEISNYKPLLNNEAISKIREGWSLKNAGDIVIGDLYLMFGAEGKLYLEYYWMDDDSVVFEKKDCDIVNEVVAEENTQKEVKNLLGNRLKTLLTMSNLLDRNKPIVSCTCGHICEKKLKVRTF